MLARKAALNFANTILGALLGLVAMKVIALYLGDVIFGQVGYALGLAGLVTLLGDPALSTAHTKRLAEGGRDADRNATYFLTATALLVLTLLVMGGVIVFRLFVQHKSFESTTLLTLVIITFVYGIRMVQSMMRATLNSRQETARTQLAQFADNLVRVLATVVVALAYAAVSRGAGPLAGLQGEPWTWIGTHGAESLALTYLVGAAASAAIMLYYVFRYYPIGSFDRSILGNYWRFARPMFLVSIIGTMSTYVDKTTIGYFWGAHQTGVYFGAQRIVTLLNGVPLAVGTLMLPAISSLSKEHLDDEIAELTYRAHRYTTMVLLPAIAFFIAFPRAIIHLVLSNAFYDAVPVLMILAAWTILTGMLRPFNIAMAGMDRPHLNARVGFVIAVINIVLNLVLVPANIASLGLVLPGLKGVGSALATLVATLTGYLLMRSIAHRNLPTLRSEVPSLARQVLAALVSMAVLLAINTYLVALARWYSLILFALVGGLVYLGALVVLREFDDEDKRLFLDVAHPGEMWAYIKEELLGRGG